MTRAEILAVARTQIGTPWRHQAHLLGVALDCWGLIVATAAACGDALARDGIANSALWCYGRDTEPEVLFASCERYLDRIALADVRPADIPLMRMPKWPIHFGFIGDGDQATLIHASFPHRRVVEHRLDEGWRGRIVRAYRIRGIE